MIQFSDNAAEYIAKSLSPAKVLHVELDEANKLAEVFVLPDQFSLAIGRGGQNVRLASELTTWKLNVKEEGGTQEVSSEALPAEIEAEGEAEVKEEENTEVVEEKKEE